MSNSSESGQDYIDRILQRHQQGQLNDYNDVHALIGKVQEQRGQIEGLTALVAEMTDCIGPAENQSFEQRAEELIVTEVRWEKEHSAQSSGTKPRHWHCDTHGDFDAFRAVGCPECMRECRQLLLEWVRKCGGDDGLTARSRIALGKPCPLATGTLKAGELPPLEWEVTYRVVAYDCGGYGQNDSRDGFESAEKAIEYARSLRPPTRDNAIVMRDTKPKHGQVDSVEVWSAKSGASRYE